LTKGTLDMFAEGRVLQNTSGNPASWNFPPANQGQVVEQTSVLNLSLPVVDEAGMDLYYESVDLNTDKTTAPRVDPGNLNFQPNDQRDFNSRALEITIDQAALTDTIKRFNFSGYTYKPRDTAPEVPLAGRFQWDGSILHIDGAVFIDGDLVVGNGNNNAAPIYYEGRGTIVTSGRVKILNPLRPASPPDSSTADFPNNNALGIVAYDQRSNADGSVWIEARPTPPSAPVCNDYQVALAAYGRRLIRVSGQSFVRGTLVGGSLCFGNGSTCNGQNALLYSEPTLSANLPPQLPGTERITQVIGYHELPDGAFAPAPTPAAPASAQ